MDNSNEKMEINLDLKTIENLNNTFEPLEISYDDLEKMDFAEEDSIIRNAGIISNKLDDKIDATVYSKPVAIVRKIVRRIKR